MRFFGQLFPERPRHRSGIPIPYLWPGSTAAQNSKAVFSLPQQRSKQFRVKGAVPLHAAAPLAIGAIKMGAPMDTALEVGLSRRRIFHTAQGCPIIEGQTGPAQQTAHIKAKVSGILEIAAQPIQRSAHLRKDLFCAHLITDVIKQGLNGDSDPHQNIASVKIFVL